MNTQRGVRAGALAGLAFGAIAGAVTVLDFVPLTSGPGLAASWLVFGQSLLLAVLSGSYSARARMHFTVAFKLAATAVGVLWFIVGTIVLIEWMADPIQRETVNLAVADEIGVGMVSGLVALLAALVSVASYWLTARLAGRADVANAEAPPRHFSG